MLRISVVIIAGTSISSAWAQKMDRATFMNKCTANCQKNAGKRCDRYCGQKAAAKGYQ